MPDKILKIIKAFVIPLSIICLIAFVLFLNMTLLDLINVKSKPVTENKLLKSESQSNIKGTLITSLDIPTKPKTDKNNIFTSAITENKTKNDYNSKVDTFFNTNNTNPPAKLGTNIHWTVREDPCKDVLLNEIIHQGNIQYAREEFNWDVIEPTPGSKDYSRYDEIMKSYRHYDVEILGLLAYSATWATNAPHDSNKKEFYPPRLDQWTDFVTETVSRYQDQVYAWEIWNEPNDPNFFKGSRQQYFELLRVTYQTIKSVDPNAKVISGGTTWPDPDYARDFYNSGMNQYSDGYGVHAYYCDQGIRDGHYENLAEDLGAIIQISKKNQQPVWITEFGCSSYQIGEKKQADNLAYMMTLFNSSEDIERVYWYSLKDTPHNGKEGAYGLITDSFTIKQSFNAFKFFNP